MNSRLDKGASLEEGLRAYFNAAGYFAIRGVPYEYEGFDVTDIDLWIYGRSTTVSREIGIVDAKNKKTPQAIERIFWVSGLQKALGADRAFVATTDKRQALSDFGKKLDVVVLDGSFLNRLRLNTDYLLLRLTEEEFRHHYLNPSIGKVEGGEWGRRIQDCKAQLSLGLTFDSCNQWLHHAHFFAEQAITRKAQAEGALRCLYFILSLVAAAIDYQSRDIFFLEQEERSKLLADGFRYGSRGQVGLKKIIDLSLGLVTELANDGKSVSNQIRAKLDKSFLDIPVNILSEYFSRREVQGHIFNVARELETLSMARDFVAHTAASLEVRSFMGCILDYWGIDRTHLSSGVKSSLIDLLNSQDEYQSEQPNSKGN